MTTVSGGEPKRSLHKLANYILTMLKLARNPGFRWWRFLVAACWFSLSLALMLYLSGIITFSYHSDSGIIGWINVNKYPKHQELFWFLLMTFGIPAFVLLGQLLWGLAGALFCNYDKWSIKWGFPILAVCNLPLLIVWEDLLSLKQNCQENLISSCGITIILNLIAGVCFSIRELKHSISEENLESEDLLSHKKEPILEKGKDIAGQGWVVWFRRIRVSFRVLIFFIIIPIVVYHLASKPPRKGKADLFHEGEFVIPMHEFIEGGVPYRDIYLQHGLMHNLGIPWLGAKVYGPTLTGVRLMRARTEPLGLVGVYFLLLMLIGCHPIPILIFLIAVGMQFLRIPSRALFGSLSLALIAADIRYGPSCKKLAEKLIKKPTKLRFIDLFCGWFLRSFFLFLAGSLMVMALLHSVEIGLYSLGAGVAFIAASILFRKGIPKSNRFLPIISYGIGIGLVIIPFLLYLAIHSAVDDFVLNLWVQCIFQLETWGLAFPAFFPVFSPLLATEPELNFSEWIIENYTMWYLLPIFLSLAVGYLAYRAMGEGFWKSRTAPYLLLLALSSAAFFRTPLGRSDSSHIHYGILFALILFIFFIDRFLVTGWGNLLQKKSNLLSRLRGIPKLLLGIFLATACLWFMDSKYPKKEGLRYAWKRFTRKPSETFFKTPENLPETPQLMSELPRRQARYLQRLVKYIQDNTKPDETVFDFSNHTGLLLFADRRPTSRYFQVAYATTPAMQEEVVCGLKYHKPSVVIYYFGGHPDHFDGIPTSRRHPIIDAYLKENYKPAKRIGTTWFWKPR